MGSEDRRRHGLEAGLRWSWSTLRQIERLHAIEDQIKDRTLQGTPTSFDDKARLLFWELRTETHFCVVAARHLVRALEFLDPPAGAADFPHFPEAFRDHVVTLRNCFEHWDEQAEAGSLRGGAGRAFRRLADLGVEDGAEGYRFGAGGTVIAGLSLDDLATASRAVHEALRHLEASAFVWRGWKAVSHSFGGSHDSAS